MLEESLAEFAGAIVLVTHDRFMLDRVCTEILGLDGLGGVGLFGNHAQWQVAQARLARGKKDSPSREKSKRKVTGPGLTATENKEFRDMEATILEAEDLVAARTRATEDPAVGADHVEAQKRWAQLESAKKQVEALYARWAELEGKAL